MEDTEQKQVSFYYSERAAQQFGYNTVTLSNGETLRFTCQFTGESYDDYRWEDKQLFGSVNKSDIKSFTFENFLNPESKLRHEMDKILRQRMEDEMHRDYLSRRY